MRRRIWFFILRLDYVLSFQTGLPGMVRTDTYDTALPRSLYDWELSSEMKELPPSRPVTDVTPVTFLLAKDGILVALGKIVDFLCTLGPYSYEKVLELDDELSQAQTQIPVSANYLFLVGKLTKYSAISTNAPNRRIIQRSEIAH